MFFASQTAFGQAEREVLEFLTGREVIDLPREVQQWGSHVEHVVSTQLRFRERLVALAERLQAMSPEKSPPTALVRIMGRLRIAEAAPYLLRNIDFFDRFSSRTDLTQYGPYPCAVALDSLGYAVVPRVLEHLRYSTSEAVSDKAIELCALVLLGVCRREGESADDVIAMVERAARRAQQRGPRENARNLDRLRAQLVAKRGERGELPKQDTRGWPPATRQSPADGSPRPLP
jgi:hypothetical protein